MVSLPQQLSAKVKNPSIRFNLLQTTSKQHLVCSLIISTCSSKVQKQEKSNKHLISSRINKAEISAVPIISVHLKISDHKKQIVNY